MYIGSKQIKNIKNTLVNFKDGTSQEYTKKNLQYLVSEKPVDPSSLQDFSCKEVSKDIMQVLLEHDVRESDLQGIFTIVLGNIDTERQRFLCKATGLYKHIQAEVKEIKNEDEKVFGELNKINEYVRQIRLSHYQI